MGISLGKHHLTTAIQMKVIEDFVLTDEYKSARELYPIFAKEVRDRTSIEPVLGHNFLIHLRKLCDEGRAQSTEKREKTRYGTDCVNPTKLFRSVKNGKV
jgi:hypothetical protein